MKSAAQKFLFTLAMIISILTSGCSLKSLTTTSPTPAIVIPTQTVTTSQTPVNVILSDDYLKDCRSIFPTVLAGQVGFGEIYPGISTKDQIINQLGSPDKSDTTSEGEEYIYLDADAKYATHVFMKGNLASSINVGSDNTTWFPLQNILEKYGCPDLMIASASDTDLPDNPLVYDGMHLAYLQAGLWFVFDVYPIGYSDSPIIIGYEKPRTVDDYLEQVSYYLDKKILMIVTFSEAVK